MAYWNCKVRIPTYQMRILFNILYSEYFETRRLNRYRDSFKFLPSCAILPNEIMSQLIVGEPLVGTCKHVHKATSLLVRSEIYATSLTQQFNYPRQSSPRQSIQGHAKVS